MRILENFSKIFSHTLALRKRKLIKGKRAHFKFFRDKTFISFSALYPRIESSQAPALLRCLELERRIAMEY